MSFSFNKLKALLPGHRGSGRYDNRNSVSLEPEVGFELTLAPGLKVNGSDGNESYNNGPGVPELSVHLIGARHLPSLFGLKTVQGYVIKVKVFPGSARYESSIQTCTWPKFNENFKFPMASETKSSIKRYPKEYSPNQTLPQKLFQGHFLVFTVYALLELPPGQGFDRFRGAYRSLKERSNSLIPKNKVGSSTSDKNKDKDTKGKDKDAKVESTVVALTASESKRNIGTVTCFLDPKIFRENINTGEFNTEELWMPIKDITATHAKGSNLEVITSQKGLIELVIEFCDECPDETSDEKPSQDTASHHPKRQWSLSKVSDMTRKIKTKNPKTVKQFYLKVTTSRMRCPIKVKEQFENVAGEIYVKTTICERNILVNSWKCDMFRPSLSTRWDSKYSTIYVPLNADCSNLDNISIKTGVATKNNLGRKIELGTVFIGPGTTDQSHKHWETALTIRNKPVPMWHTFQ